MLEQFILEGTVTLIALGVLVLEIAVLVFFPLASGRRPEAHLIANALSGLFLILALRAALIGSGATAIATFLGLALIAHVGDVMSRKRG